MNERNDEVVDIAHAEGGEVASLTDSWTYMQGVLDDALDAVRGAREKNSELAAAIENYKSRVIDLEDQCASLRARVLSAQEDAERSDDAIGMFRRENVSLVKRYDKAMANLVQFNEAMKQARKLETRVKRITDAMVQLEKSTSEIRAHYSGDADEQETFAQELNFARDVALEQIRSALNGVRAGSPAEKSSHEPAAR